MFVVLLLTHCLQTKPNHSRSSSGHHAKPTNPFNKQYPPVGDKVINRWTTEAQLSLTQGRRPHSPSENKQVKQNLKSF